MSAVCLEPGCPNLRPCTVAGHEPDRRSPSSRVTGTRRWRERTKPAVLKRNGRCHYCGAPAVTADHALAVSNGGAHHDLANLLPSCGPCNAAKGNR
jgi:5-methylcytosine-specific restriction endonuclease McrA